MSTQPSSEQKPSSTQSEQKILEKQILFLKGKRTNKTYKIQYQGEIDSEDMENYRAMVDEWENEELGSDRDDDH